MSRHAISEKTPKNIMLGAGTIHQGLVYADGTGWNFDETIIGATSGGSKVTIVPEYKDLEVDGAWVKVEGLTVKTGETATMEVNFIELSSEILGRALNSEAVNEPEASMSGVEYDVIFSSPAIYTSNYIDNLAFVGELINGNPIIVLFQKALCTSGLELSSGDKDGAVITLTFEAYKPIASGEYSHLGYSIYYPSAV